MSAFFRMLPLLLALLMPTAQAQQSVGLPQGASAVLPNAAAIGSGAYRWFGLKLYDATLWAERRNFSPSEWYGTPLALELVYARSLKGEKIADASVDQIKKLGIASAMQLRAWGDAMKRVFPDVDEGVRLTGLYQPGQPARFFRNGEPIGEIADPAFGQAFFAIWLHPNSSAPKLRASLLGL